MDRLRAIEVFVRVAECGSFSRAAESLDVGNATVTSMVRNLERHLSVTLIDRDTRRLRLTEEGQAYFELTRDLLESLARAEEELQSRVRAPSGRLHIETTISFGHALLCPALPEFAKRYPDITAVVALINQPQNMIESAIDVAIRLGHVEDADLVARPLCETSYVLCCAPQLAPSLPDHPSRLDPRQCIGHLSSDRRFILPWQLQRGDEEFELKPGGPFHFNSSEHVLEIARGGTGVACVLDVLASRDFANGTLVRVCSQWTTAAKTLYIVTPKSRVGSVKVKVFTEFMFAMLQGLRPPRPHQMVGVKAPGRR